MSIGERIIFILRQYEEAATAPGGYGYEGAPEGNEDPKVYADELEAVIRELVADEVAKLHSSTTSVDA